MRWNFKALYQRLENIYLQKTLPRICMMKIIFIYMHICKCKHYTHENDVAKLYKKVLYLMVEEFHHQFQLFELQYNATVLTSCTKCSWEEKLTRLVFWSIYIFSATAKEEIYMNSPWSVQKIEVQESVGKSICIQRSSLPQCSLQAQGVNLPLISNFICHNWYHWSSYIFSM